jgi:hypothetical protein
MSVGVEQESTQTFVWSLLHNFNIKLYNIDLMAKKEDLIAFTYIQVRLIRIMHL